MKKTRAEIIKKSASLFLGLMSWYSAFEITSLNLIKNDFTNFIVVSILTLIGVVLIFYSIISEN
mgnify:CR=1 FL=1